MRPALRRAISASAILAVCACGTGEGPASAVTGLAEALADSDYASAWSMITPESQAWYDSTVFVLHHFGYLEASPALERLAGGMTEEEFTALTGQELFARMSSASETAHCLSTSIRSVEYVDSTFAIVVVRTSRGSQEIPVRLTPSGWAVDIAGLVPPPEE